MAKVTLGSVSTGTLREDHLIVAFLEELEAIDADRAAVICKAYPGVVEWARESAFQVMLADLPAGIDVDAPNWLLDSLTDELNENAPVGAYFGAHEGDGADFGFWPLTEN